MLTLFQLQHLPLQEQVQYVMDNGEFFITQVEKDYIANLYWIGSIHAKIIYSTETDQISQVIFNEESFYDYY